ncbi:aminotransferase-like domain-containing protein [Shumkonia mesophila]|uniref:aminotransferase-like domain-containing protein n=1 Tax=Shumkonia mesophila TaxID=2838854 RepID=UPI002934383D|nr:PLP-dependent aminotransferase family protein [Shumkonia mesophila]
MNARDIAEALEASIRDGRLPPGARLPTHRDLAYRHGVALNTATRAMRMLAERGLVVGEVGRGSFVRAPGQPDSEALWIERDIPSLIDLTGNVMSLPGLAERFEAATLAVLRRQRHALTDYQPHAGRDQDRAAAAAWLARRGGLPNDPARTLVCAGAQHAVMVALMATTRPGDAVAVEALTWPGIKAVAAALRLNLVPVAIDDRGLRPRALQRVAVRHRIAALYCMPDLHNPTSAVMTARRREMVAALARRHDFALIEDDAYGFLTDQAHPPLAALAPERAWYVRSTSKAMLPALRAAWMLAPPGHEQRASDLIRATVWMAPPLGAAIASLWIADGTAAALEEEKRREAHARQRMAAAALPAAWGRSTHPFSMHFWLKLPDGLRADDAVGAALAAGVRVAPGRAFAVQGAPNAIRLALGRPLRREDLAEALRRLLAAWGRGAA